MNTGLGPYVFDRLTCIFVHGESKKLYTKLVAQPIFEILSLEDYVANLSKWLLRIPPHLALRCKTFMSKTSD